MTANNIVVYTPQPNIEYLVSTYNATDKAKHLSTPIQRKFLSSDYKYLPENLTEYTYNFADDVKYTHIAGSNGPISGVIPVTYKVPKADPNTDTNAGGKRRNNRRKSAMRKGGRRSRRIRRANNRKSSRRF